MTAKTPTERQRESRDRRTKAGGRWLSGILSPAASKRLEKIKKRDSISGIEAVNRLLEGAK